MPKTASSLLLYILIASQLQKSLTSDSSATLSTESSESQCGGYCFTALKPILDHIAANQQRWNACDATNQQCEAKLERIESQLVVLQEKVSAIEAVKTPEGNLVVIPKAKKLENFVQIGSRFFYIEQHHRVNWFAATNICRQMGGHLASPSSEKEWSAIKERLTRGRNYWLGISDLATEGLYLSQATGNMASYLSWSSGEPNNHNNKENCVELRSDSDFLMNDIECTYKTYFICEAANESIKMIKVVPLLLCMLIAVCLQGSSSSDSVSGNAGRLDRVESQVAVLQAQQEGGSDNFWNIGSKFFYIEENQKVNWHSALNICRELGGHLADPDSQQELNSIKQRLTRGRHYWLGISDLANEGLFLSQDTGKRATFLKWIYGEPNNYGSYEHCVELKSQKDRPFLMNDAPCGLKSYFICERE
ncbi:macrophage mannose receptor 1-like [Drosophila guanche]|nr:macrophage mannose receptor 1-like [Drosophila guanche]